MNPFPISGLLAGSSSITFGLLVLLKTKNRRLGRVWFVFSLSVAVWAFGAAWFSTTRSPEMALVAIHLAYAFGVVWIAALFHHFVSIFLGQTNERLVIVNYCIALGFCLLSPTRYFFENPRWLFGSMYYPLAGPCYPIFFAWWIALVFYAHYQLIRTYKSVTEQKKNQIKYFFLATFIGFTGGCTAYLPNFKVDIYPWGHFTVMFFPFIMAYAVVKHRLMGVEILIRKTVVYGCALLLGIGGYIAFVAHFTHRAIGPLANFSILTGIMSLGMAIFFIAKAPKRKVSLLWILTCLSIGIWSYGFGMMTRSQSFEACLFWQKWFVYLGAIMIPVVYLHFVTLLVEKKQERLLGLCYAAALIFQGLNISGLLATAKIKPPFNYYTEGIFPAYHAYVLFFFVVAAYAHWLLFKRLKTAGGSFRNQIQYVFIGTSVGFLGGCMTFPLSFNIHIFPIGTYLVAFYLLAVTCAVYKHHLMDIHVAVRKSLVYTLMTAILTAIYLVLLTRGTQILQDMFGASTTTVSIAVACVITGVFVPLRNRVQLFVDRYFFHDWADREIVREVAAGFSHELKSPLAGLSMQAQLALSEIQDAEKGRVRAEDILPKIKEALRYLVAQSTDAARRIEAVRGVAEPAEGQIEPVDIPAVLDSSLAHLERVVHESQVTIRRDLPKRLSAVRSNTKQLEIVFINLMKNALQAMDNPAAAGPHSLFLSASEQDGVVLISVKDTGAGISNRDVSRIFEPYFTTKGHKGTGMGLYLTHQIVKAHGGTIEVTSEPGQGTEFIVRLPKYNQSRIAAA